MKKYWLRPFNVFLDEEMGIEIKMDSCFISFSYIKADFLKYAIIEC